MWVDTIIVLIPNLLLSDNIYDDIIAYQCCWPNVYLDKDNHLTDENPSIDKEQNLLKWK